MGGSVTDDTQDDVSQMQVIEEAEELAPEEDQGFVIVLSSFLILKVISFVTGAECINALGFDSCS